jgi:hypothetical protein
MRPSSRGRHHSCHLVIEARVGAAVAGQAEVNRSQLIDPQAAEVAFDTLAQLMRIDPLDGLDLDKFGLARERFGD